MQQEYSREQFQISVSLKPYGAGDPIFGGVNPFLVGLLMARIRQLTS